MAKKTSMATKKFLHIAYNIGASIVIIGALFKINHFQIGFLTGGLMLAIGLITEAIIFAMSAILEDVEEETDWSLVYPELAGDNAKEKDPNAKGLLTQKLDTMLKESNLDAALIQSLAESIKNFKVSSDNLNVSIDTVSNTHKYNEEMAVAAVHLESLNNLYKIQSENSERQSFINDSVLKHSEKIEEQMNKYNKEIGTAVVHLESLNKLYKIQSENSEHQFLINDSIIKHSEKIEKQMEMLTTNLSSLNTVYDGMLSAMQK